MKYLRVSEGRAIGIDKYPNFHKSGSIKGMKEKYYGKNAYLVQCGNYIYNVPYHIYTMAKGYISECFLHISEREIIMNELLRQRQESYPNSFKFVMDNIAYNLKHTECCRCDECNSIILNNLGNVKYPSQCFGGFSNLENCQTHWGNMPTDDELVNLIDLVHNTFNEGECDENDFACCPYWDMLIVPCKNVHSSTIRKCLECVQYK